MIYSCSSSTHNSQVSTLTSHRAWFFTSALFSVLLLLHLHVAPAATNQSSNLVF